MNLRDRIEKAIVEAEDAERAAIEVCIILEEQIGLASNGWFDDDEYLLDRLIAE